MTSLSDALAVPTADTRYGDKHDFQIEFDPEDFKASTVSMTYPGEALQTEDDWRKAVEEMGSLKIPEGYTVRLVEMKHQTHGWTRKKQGKDAVTAPTWWYRFAIEKSVVRSTSIDDLVKKIDRRKPRKAAKAAGPGVFHVFGGDMQFGKPDGGGAQAIIDSVYQSLDQAIVDFKRLRRSESLGMVHLAWVGDCIEGNQSQGGRNTARNDLTVTEQLRLFRRMMYDYIDAFAPLVERVEVDVVNGNHDDVQRHQISRGDDGHATESAIAVSEGLERNPAVYGHTQIYVPGHDQTHMTRQIGSSTFTFIHGHQWSRGKAWDWWKGQTFNRQQPAASDFLIHGHYHTAAIDTKRDRTIISVPTHEDRSQWYMDRTGDMAKQGSYIATSRDGEFANLAIV